MTERNLQIIGTIGSWLYMYTHCVIHSSAKLIVPQAEFFVWKMKNNRSAIILHFPIGGYQYPGYPH